MQRSSSGRPWPLGTGRTGSTSSQQQQAKGQEAKEQFWQAMASLHGEDWFDVVAAPAPAAAGQRSGGKSSSCSGTTTTTAGRAGDVPAIFVREIIRTQGVPPSFRARVWLALSGAQRARSRAPTTYYSDLLWLCRNSPSAAAAPGVQRALRQIALDIPRTFPSHPWFQSEEGCLALENVLTAYALRNSEVRYCQGLNFLAATLLLVTQNSEEDAFWLLTVLVEHILPPHTYSELLLGTAAEHARAAFLTRLRDACPRTYEHLSEHLLYDPSLLPTQWLMTLFTTSHLPAETTLRLWDILFTEGTSDVLLAAAVTIFCMCEDRLLASCSDEHAHAALAFAASQVTADADTYLAAVASRLPPPPESEQLPTAAAAGRGSSCASTCSARAARGWRLTGLFGRV